MEKLISVAVMRESDASEIASGTDSKILMYRAGLGIFRSFDWHGRIDIVTGSGNNGGDGYAAARLWSMDGGRSLVWELSGQPKGDAAVNRTLLGMGFLREYAGPDERSEEPAGYCRKTFRYGRKVDKRWMRLMD